MLNEKQFPISFGKRLINPQMSYSPISMATYISWGYRPHMAARMIRYATNETTEKRIAGNCPRIPRLCGERHQGNVLQKILSRRDQFILPFEQKIGIELETEGMHYRSVPLPKKLAKKGWSEHEDGSLGRYGREFVSAPVTIPEGKQQFFSICRAFSPHAKNSSSCGLHVHIGYQLIDSKCPFTSKELRKREQAFLKELAVLRTKEEWQLLFKNRDRSDYSKRIPSHEDCRFTAVNFHSYGKYKTIEIRYGRVPKKLSKRYVKLVHKWIDFIYKHFGQPDYLGQLKEPLTEMNTLGQARRR